MKVRHSGQWKEFEPFVRQSGNWKHATPSVRHNGQWHEYPSIDANIIIDKDMDHFILSRYPDANKDHNVIWIKKGVTISSTEVSTPAFRLDMGVVELINDGLIVGCGGNGGDGEGVFTSPKAGTDGGIGMFATVKTSITNNGLIAGGGGGGGGGTTASGYGDHAGGGGGGGGAGYGKGGEGGSGNRSGSKGYTAKNKEGGKGGGGGTDGMAVGGRGGDGGDPGFNGSNGNFGNTGGTPANGGKAGIAISGEDKVTWIKKGDVKP